MRVSLRRRWTLLRAQPDRGAVTVELVLATPLMVLCLLFVIQAGVWMHATHIAQTTAQRALESARAYNGSTSAGYDTAEQTLHALAGGTLKDAEAHVTRGATQATAEIDGYAATVVPGLRLRVRAHVTGGVERFVPDTGVP